MAQVNATVAFDPGDSEKPSSATVTLGLAGHSEMEHELLRQFFTQRGVRLVPFHDGDILQARFVITQPDAFPKAQRAVENRIRTRDGRLTVEEEQEQAEARKKAEDSEAE